MKNYQEYKSYFSQLVSYHQGIKSFVVGGVEQMLSEARADLEYPCLWLERPDVKWISDEGNTDQIQWSGAFVILTNSEIRDDEELENILETNFSYAEHIMSKIRYDHLQPGALSSDLNFSIDPINSILADNTHGWRVEFTISYRHTLCFDLQLWL